MLSHMRGAVRAIYQADLREIRRSAWAWVFAPAPAVVAGAVFGHYAGVHAVMSSLSALAGGFGPKYLLPEIAPPVLWLCLVAVVFAAVEVRKRDAAAAAQDAKPLSNVALLAGRVAALATAAWLPLLVAAAVAWLLGPIGGAFGWWAGDALATWSLAGFVFLDAPTVLVLWSSVTVLLATLLRRPWVAAAVGLTLLGLLTWGFSRMPAYLWPALSPLSSYGASVSDIAPRLIDLGVLAQRGALWCLAAACVAFAAAHHPREDRRRPPLRFAGGAFFVGGAAILGALTLGAAAGLSQRSDWLAAHRAVESQAALPDVEHVSGKVAIDPRGSTPLVLDIALRLRAPAERSLEQLVFSFNPGFAVSQLRVDDQPAQFAHEQGLLTVELAEPLAPGDAVTLALSAKGVPDGDFAYLDSAVDWRQRTAGNGLRLLGTEAAIFARDYVALTPAVHWLPTAGASVGATPSEARPADYFTVALEVRAPAGWLVAGPGRRHGEDAAFAFRPQAPVPAVALFAARFERRAMEVGGVELELLLNPKHTRNVGYFASAAASLKQSLEGTFAQGQALGLPYPYDGFTLVEVPSRLRGYDGGWRMDTALAQPGILALKEQSFPTAHFRPYPQRDRNDPAVARFQQLMLFFQNDRSGGNSYRALARNLLLFQTSAEAGPDAGPQHFVCQELLTRLLVGPVLFSPAFSARFFDVERGFGSGLIEAVRGFLGYAPARGILRLGFPATDAEVWELASSSSLVEASGEAHPAALDAFLLRGGAVAHTVLDGLGASQAAAALARLRADFQGRRFTADDFAAALSDEAADLLGDWLHDAALPGFLVSSARVRRLADDEQGQPRYESRVHVYNDENAPGLVRLAATEHGLWGGLRSDPIRVGAKSSVEIGWITPAKLDQLWLLPYLSLNRAPLRLAFAPEAIASDEELNGSIGSAWRPPPTQGIVVDDLDAGFRVETGDNGKNRVESPDQPPPSLQRRYGFGAADGVCRRQEVSSAWGKYWRTIVRCPPGGGERRLVFTAELPHAGRWQLALHNPDRIVPELGEHTGFVGGTDAYFLFGELGAYDIRLHADGETAALEFDGAAAATGWRRFRRVRSTCGNRPRLDFQPNRRRNGGGGRPPLDFR